MTVREEKRYARACSEAEDFNAAHREGTLVRFWPGSKDQPARRSFTRGRAWALLSGFAVVRVDGYPGGIALSHVEPISAEGGE